MFSDKLARPIAISGKFRFTRVFTSNRSTPIHRFSSARVGISYRAVGVRDGETMVWYWIGSHADYDDLVAQM